MEKKKTMMMRMVMVVVMVMVQWRDLNRTAERLLIEKQGFKNGEMESREGSGLGKVRREKRFLKKRRKRR